MNYRVHHRCVLAGILVLLFGVSTLSATGVTAQQEPPVATLLRIRAAPHPEADPPYDRIVFDFSGKLPGYQVRYIPEIHGDFSDLPIPVAGNAFLAVSFSPARAHTDEPKATVPNSVAFGDTKNIVQVVRAGDFEVRASFGIGLAREEQYRVFTLPNPDRVVIDIVTPFRTVLVRTYFVDEQKFATGQEPYVTPVWRPVIPPAVAKGALQRLFAGPTQREATQRLRLVSSQATGFTNLGVADGIAQVQLTGGCDSGGSTLTIANEIMPTLKQFATVQYVKIYDPAGNTADPHGYSDSIPECLNP